MVTSGRYYHVVREVHADGHRPLLVYVCLDRARANLAMARRELALLALSAREGGRRRPALPAGTSPTHPVPWPRGNGGAPPVATAPSAPSSRPPSPEPTQQPAQQPSSQRSQQGKRPAGTQPKASPRRTPSPTPAPRRAPRSPAPSLQDNRPQRPPEGERPVGPARRPGGEGAAGRPDPDGKGSGAPAAGNAPPLPKRRAARPPPAPAEQGTTATEVRSGSVRGWSDDVGTLRRLRAALGRLK